MRLISHEEGRGKSTGNYVVYLGMESPPWIIDYVKEFTIGVLVALTIYFLSPFGKKLLSRLHTWRKRNCRLTIRIYQGGQGKFINTNPQTPYFIHLDISNRWDPVKVVKANVWVDKNDNGQRQELIHRSYSGENKTISTERVKESINIPNTLENRGLLKNSKLFVELIDTENKSHPCKKYLIPNI